MMTKTMGLWMLAAVVAGGSQAAAVDAPSSTLGDYAILGVREVTLRSRVRVLSGDVGCNAPDGTVTLISRANVSGAVAGNEIRMGQKTSAGALFCTLLKQDGVKGGATGCVATTPPLVDSALLPIVQVSPGTEDKRLAKGVTLDPLAP